MRSRRRGGGHGASWTGLHSFLRLWVKIKTQAAVAEMPEPKGTIKFVKTCEFWEPEVEEMVNKGVWKGPDWVKFYNVGSDRGYHYLGSARIYYKMGKAFAEGMIELLKK